MCVCVHHLSYVECVRVSFDGIAGIREGEVQSRLLQHLLVPVLVVLPVGRETAAVAPVFFDRNLQGDKLTFFFKRCSSHSGSSETEGFLHLPAAGWRRKARTGNRTPRRNEREGRSSNPSSQAGSCRSACPRRRGRMDPKPPTLPALIQLRLWDWRRGRAESGPPESNL